jgi:Zn-dependent membrane protease YugP
MLYALLGIVITFAVYFPSLWVRYVMHRHARQIDDMPGTGGELAEHLIQRFELEGYTVEVTSTLGDHFDPGDCVVRLSENNYNGKSLTAIAIAAHEVGHAIQHQRQEKIFQLRSKYLPSAQRLQNIGVFILAAVPFIAILVRSPGIIMAVLGVSLLLQTIGALSYLIVLPEEWDASFNKALPILLEGDYIQDEQIGAVNSVLKAAALTYFASALAHVLNIGRWLMVLRR